jgi:ribosomal protein S12 methylthiotransferase
MLGQLAQAGLRVVSDERRADVVIVNTCGFIDTAKEESINTIIELGELKKTGRCRTLIATGCLTQRYQGELLKELPELDAIVGTGDFPQIAEIVRSRLGSGESASRSWFEHPTFLYDAATPRRRIGPQHWAYVKISEGCDKRCAFCAIPSFRGDLVSRTVDSVVAEARQLAVAGVREVNLIAQDLPAFGMDHGRKGDLITLVRALSAVDELRWIRLMYLYPHKLPPGLIDLFAEEPKLVPYVEMPIQHIDDGILRSMNRGGSSAEIRRTLDAFRNRVPGVAIRTSFIVGFPGEGEREFAQLAAFVEEQQFDRVAVFTYSMEEGTAAAKLGDPIPIRPRVKAGVSSCSISNSHRGRRKAIPSVGSSLDSHDRRVRARRPVRPGVPDGYCRRPRSTAWCIWTRTLRSRDFVEVEITDALGYDPVATPIVRQRLPVITRRAGL